MPSTNGYGLKRTVLWAILYARVSTDEQARSGYSLAQQLEALREYVTREGYEVLEEVVDAGQSGASLERPGMDRVRDLVAAGSVSVVLAQDRDRIAREPAYHYLLRREFEEHGTKIRALNDRGDDSPEGELTDGILDQLGKYERAKTAERSRRGKLRKAREGKVIAIHTPNYGFKYNASRDGYEVDEEAMRVVRRIFRMVGSERRTLYAVKRTLEREGIPTPSGARFWHAKCIRNYLSEDVYKRHTDDEIMAMVDAGQMSAAVASGLDPSKSYGIWWFNRRRTRRTQVSTVGPDGDRTYKKKGRYVERPKEEWVAVPVPDSGIPREWVDTARDTLKGNSVPSSAGRRVWEISGGIAKCKECGRNMMIQSVMAPRAKGRRFYYRCRSRSRDGAGGCVHRKCHRADEVEPRVWNLISSLLKDPGRLKAGLEEMIEQERAGLRGDPDQEAKTWLEKLSEVDQERRGYLRLAAKGVLADEELDEVLAELEETRETAERELRAISARRETLEKLERDKEALLGHYARMTPDALDALEPEERHQVYKMLRLTVEVCADGSLEVSGVLGDSFVPGNQDEYAIGPHIKPALGRMKLKSLTPAHVRRFYREKLDAGLAPATVHKMHAVLHKALDQAVADGLIPRNAADALKLPRIDREEIAPLTADEANRLIEAARGDRLEALYVLAIHTGLRQGELLALNWEDLDLEAGTLQVRRTLTRRGGKHFLSEPKTKKSRRTVRLTAGAIAALQDHLKRQMEEMDRLGSLYKPGGLVFANEIGGIFNPSNLRNRSFARLLMRAGLSAETRFHDLRHTCATLLLSRNVNPKIVSEMLGHANISITLDTYSHVLPDMQEKAAKALEEALR